MSSLQALRRGRCVWITSVLVAVLLLSVGGCQRDEPDDPGEDADVRRIEPGSGVEVSQVDFQFSEAQVEGSSWGRVSVEPERLAESSGIQGGYLNVTTEQGWAVRNLPVGEEQVSVYFDLGEDYTEGTRIDSFDLSVTQSKEPQRNVARYAAELLTYKVATWVWSAEGAGERFTVDWGRPPYLIEIVDLTRFFPLDTWARYQAVTNVHAAHNQCFPMAIANSLQFLEDEGEVTVPHDHVAGLRGDNSLVGQLDTACDRSVTSRSNGFGVWFTPMMEGKFEYLDDNGLDADLTHRHQGRGYGTPPNEALAPGDFTHEGITSQDDGAAVTWEWLCDRVAEGCDVEVVFSYDNSSGTPTGGHAVRLTGCGMVAGSPWVRYSHDASQTNSDPMDNMGLENVVVWPDDTDSDGTLNFGSANRELRFALAECP